LARLPTSAACLLHPLVCVNGFRADRVPCGPTAVHQLRTSGAELHAPSGKALAEELETSTVSPSTLPHATPYHASLSQEEVSDPLTVNSVHKRLRAASLIGRRATCSMEQDRAHLHCPYSWPLSAAPHCARAFRVPRLGCPSCRSSPSRPLYPPRAFHAAVVCRPCPSPSHPPGCIRGPCQCHPCSRRAGRSRVWRA